jgi:hypothetical protein
MGLCEYNNTVFVYYYNYNNSFILLNPHVLTSNYWFVFLAAYIYVAVLLRIGEGSGVLVLEVS